MITPIIFTNAMLNVDFQLIYTHAFSTSQLSVEWYDENGIKQSTDNVFQIIDDDTFVLNCNEAITGNNILLVFYDSETPAITGNRLFERDLITTVDNELRYVLGNQDSPTYNITHEQLVAVLFASLGFLKKASNLSDIDNPATALSNIGGVNLATLQANTLGKANLYGYGSAGGGAALGVLNQQVFTPSLPYHPCTKSYAESLFNKTTASILATGRDTTITSVQESTCGKSGNTAFIKIAFKISTPSQSTPVTFGVLPSGYIPDGTRNLPMTYWPTGASEGGMVRIETNGEIKIYAGRATTGTDLWFCNITYIL